MRTKATWRRKDSNRGINYICLEPGTTGAHRDTGTWSPVRQFGRRTSSLALEFPIFRAVNSITYAPWWPEGRVKYANAICIYWTLAQQHTHTHTRTGPRVTKFSATPTPCPRAQLGRMRVEHLCVGISLRGRQVAERAGEQKN